MTEMESAADGGGVQALQDIESYLANFNREISDEPVPTFTFMAGASDGQGSNELYADPNAVYQTSPEGHLKLEGSSDNTALKQIPQQVISAVAVGDNSISLLASNGQLDGQTFSLGDTATYVDRSSNDQVKAMSCNSSTVQRVNVSSNNDLMLQQQQSTGQAGSGGFQTVTIVPSEVNQNGEVSYMLIVSQPDDDKGGDLSVFDFKEEKQMERANAEEAKKAKQAGRSQSFGGQPSQLMCNYCNYTSPKRFLLARHMKAHSEERPYTCEMCSRAFKTTLALTNHVNTHNGIRPNKCKECDSCFTTSGELIRHVRYRHTYEKPHRCTVCDYASVELSKLKRHVRSHTGERPYQCPHCMYASPDSFKLKRHLRVHTGEKPYVCDICDMHFTQSNSLKSHKLIHSGNKPIFQCELCPTTCGRKTDLKNHVLKIHTSDRPLQCKKCGKSFPDRYTYKIHMRTHDGQKCFRCELCPYSALLQRHLESHILTHTGEKPFRCTDCNQSFRQKQLLRRHVNLYHNPEYVAPEPRSKVHQCQECNKCFAHEGNLLRHLTQHYPDNIEYQLALENGEASVGEEDDDEGEPQVGQVAQMYGNGHQVQNLNQIQVQLLPSDGDDGQQTYRYIQIDSNQLGLLHQMDGFEGGVEEVEVQTPVKRRRGRPRKIFTPGPLVSDEEYTPKSIPRKRGRQPKCGRSSAPAKLSRSRVKEEEEEEEEAYVNEDELDETNAEEGEQEEQEEEGQEEGQEEEEEGQEEEEEGQEEEEEGQEEEEEQEEEEGQEEEEEQEEEQEGQEEEQEGQKEEQEGQEEGQEEEEQVEEGQDEEGGFEEQYQEENEEVDPDYEGAEETDTNKIKSTRKRLGEDSTTTLSKKIKLESNSDKTNCDES